MKRMLLPLILLMFLSCTKEIKISVVVPLSGDLSEYGKDIEKGVNLAHCEKGFSKWGKVGIIIEDNKGEREKTREIITRMGKDNSILGVIGPATTRNALVAADIAEYYQMPLVAPAITTSLVTLDKRCVKSLSVSNFHQGRTLAHFAFEDLRCRKTGVLLMKNIYSEEITHAFADEFQILGGAVSALLFYTEGDKDFRSQLADIKRKEVDCILVPGYYEDIILIISQARALGIEVPILGGDGWFSLDVMKASARGKNFFVTPFFPDTAFDFTKKYMDEYGELPTDGSYLGYLAYKEFIEIMEGIEELTRDEIIKNLESLTDSKNLFIVEFSHEGLRSREVIKIKG